MAVYIAHPLSMIFNLIMQNGALPDILKTAFVTPIFKKGLASEPGNYRPISITCIACRIFERIVKEYLIEHLNRNRVFNPAQHGFLAGHSTCTNLLESMADWTTNLDNKTGTIVTYIDYQKAFDSVSIPKLIHKLKHLDITGKLLNCLASFLTNRSQKVKVENQFSNTRFLRSGVPQGSVLGPILFIVYTVHK